MSSFFIIPYCLEFQQAYYFLTLLGRHIFIQSTLSQGLEHDQLINLFGAKNIILHLSIITSRFTKTPIFYYFVSTITSIIPYRLDDFRICSLRHNLGCDLFRVLGHQLLLWLMDKTSLTEYIIFQKITHFCDYFPEKTIILVTKRGQPIEKCGLLKQEGQPIYWASNGYCPRPRAQPIQRPMVPLNGRERCVRMRALAALDIDIFSLYPSLDYIY